MQHFSSAMVTLADDERRLGFSKGRGLYRAEVIQHMDVCPACRNIHFRLCSTCRNEAPAEVSEEPVSTEEVIEPAVITVSILPIRPYFRVLVGEKGDKFDGIVLRKDDSLEGRYLLGVFLRERVGKAFGLRIEDHQPGKTRIHIWNSQGEFGSTINTYGEDALPVDVQSYTISGLNQAVVKLLE